MPQLQFNPYRDWLDLPAEPNNFYGLLGLRLYESDAETIRKAAQRTTSTVRNIKPGQRIQAWKKLLDQIEQAKETLCDPQLKAAYDERLVADADRIDPVATTAGECHQESRFDPMAPLEDVEVPPRVVLPSPLDVPLPPAELPPMAVAGRNAHSSDAESNAEPEEFNHVGRAVSSPAARNVYRRRAWRKQQFNTRLAVILVCTTFVGLAAAFWLVLQIDPWSLRSGVEPKVAETPHRTSEDPQPAAIDAAKKSAPGTSPSEIEIKNEAPIAMPDASDQTDSHPPDSPVMMRPAEVKTAQPAPDPTPVVEPAPEPGVNPGPTATEIAEVRRLLREAHRALTAKEVQRCDELLQQLQSMPTDPEGTAMVERFAALSEYVFEFWKAVDDGLKKVEGSELTLNQTTVFVVEVDSESIILRVLGKNRRIDRIQLPSGLALALADQWFDQNASSTKVFKGAYMAVTPRFSAEEVKQMWSDAAREGAELDDLMQVLDDRGRLGV